MVVRPPSRKCPYGGVLRGSGHRPYFVVDPVAIHPLGDVDLRLAPLDLAEGEGNTRLVLVDRFTQATKLNILPLTHVKSTGIGNVQHDGLTNLCRISGRHGSNRWVLDRPKNIQR